MSDLKRLRAETDSEAIGFDLKAALAAERAAVDAERKKLLTALRLADAAMEHMGEILNGMDAVTEEDERLTTPAFEAVHAITREEASDA